MTLRRASVHPFESYADDTDRVPTCWAEDYWKVYIYSKEHMQKAVRDVEDNSIKEGRARQHWEFVLPLSD